MKKIGLILMSMLLLVISIPAVAQADSGMSAFGETMRSNGRIYVVVAVILTILFGIILYLIRLERKIKKLEKNS